MLTVRELIHSAEDAGLRNALPQDNVFSVQTRTRALYIGLMPDPQTEEMVTYLSLYFGDAGTASIMDMVNLVLRYDPNISLFMLEIQPEDGDASDELLAYAGELGLQSASAGLALVETRARTIADRMIAETRRTFTARELARELR